MSGPPATASALARARRGLLHERWTAAAPERGGGWMVRCGALDVLAPYAWPVPGAPGGVVPYRDLDGAAAADLLALLPPDRSPVLAAVLAAAVRRPGELTVHGHLVPPSPPTAEARADADDGDVVGEGFVLGGGAEPAEVLHEVLGGGRPAFTRRRRSPRTGASEWYAWWPAATGSGPGGEVGHYETS